jgi:hypothetical protein
MEQKEISQELEDINAIPQKTQLYGDSTKERQPTVDNMSYKIISTAAAQRNKKMSQGVITYEIVKMSYPRINDAIDELEESVNERLEEHEINPQDIDGIIYSDGHIPEFDGEKSHTVRFWLPHDLASSISQNPEIPRVGQYINQCVNEYIHHPFRDRTHRIDVKRDLLKAIKYDNKKLDGIAKQIRDNSDRLHIPENLVKKFNIEIEDITDFTANKDIFNNWESRVQKFQEVSRFNDIDDSADMLARLYDIDNIYHVKDKIRLYGDMSEFENDGKGTGEPADVRDSKGKGSIGLAAQLADKHTIPEIIMGYVKNPDITKTERLSTSNLRKIYRILRNGSEYQEDFETFKNRFIFDNDGLAYKKGKNKDFIMLDV